LNKILAILFLTSFLRSFRLFSEKSLGRIELPFLPKGFTDTKLIIIIKLINTLAGYSIEPSDGRGATSSLQGRPFLNEFEVLREQARQAKSSLHGRPLALRSLPAAPLSSQASSDAGGETS
jgi:hypothetical protein